MFANNWAPGPVMHHWCIDEVRHLTVKNWSHCSYRVQNNTQSVWNARSWTPPFCQRGPINVWLVWVWVSTDWVSFVLSVPNSNSTITNWLTEPWFIIKKHQSPRMCWPSYRHFHLWGHACLWPCLYSECAYHQFRRCCKCILWSWSVVVTWGTPVWGQSPDKPVLEMLAAATSHFWNGIASQPFRIGRYILGLFSLKD